MPERSSVSQVVQIGVESTPGTAVACNRRLSSISISPSVATDIEMFTPTGNKFATVQALNKEWSESSMEGQPSYNELHYLFGSLFGAGVAAQVMDGATPTGVYEWTFSPASSAEDAPITLTIEKGSTASRTHRTAYGLVNELDLDLSRSDVSLGGSIFSQTIADGVTLNTVSVTTPPLVPLLPSGVNVYLDATSAALGTTKLTRAISVHPKVGNRYNPTWFLNSAVPSFTNHVETVNDATVEFMVEADAQGMALLANMRAGDTRFLRLEVVGPGVYTGATPAGYRLWWDMAIKISEVKEFSDEDGIYAIGYTGTFVHDATYGRATQVRLRSTQPTL